MRKLYILNYSICFAQTAALQLRGCSCSAAYAAVGARRQLRLRGCSCGVGDGNDGNFGDTGDDSDVAMMAMVAKMA